MVQGKQDVRRQLASTGAALGSVWGGPQKQLYYTPSGEEVWALPSIREWVRRDDNGKVVAQGTRDANLDKGWALNRPTDLKLHCTGCDHWHDTEDDVAECVEAKSAASQVWEKKARQMSNGSGAHVDDDTSDRLTVLEQGQARIEALLLKLTGGED